MIGNAIMRGDFWKSTGRWFTVGRLSYRYR